MMGLGFWHWYLIGAIISGEMMLRGIITPNTTVKAGQSIFPALLFMYVMWPLVWTLAILAILWRGIKR